MAHSFAEVEKLWSMVVVEQNYFDLDLRKGIDFVEEFEDLGE